MGGALVHTATQELRALWSTPSVAAAREKLACWFSSDAAQKRLQVLCVPGDSSQEVMPPNCQEAGNAEEDMAFGKQ